MNDLYHSIQKQVSAEVKEKGSKFLAFAFPVADESEVKEKLQELKEEYWDASHHCYAYMIGPDYNIYRANDAGEPSHSAGDPILSQIKSFNLTDILVVVVRYFGGTKLGVSGLVSAYKASAREALTAATVVEKFVTVNYGLKFGPENTSLVMKSIKNADAEIIEQDFDYETVKTVMSLKIRKSKEESFLKNLQGTLGVQVTCDL